MMWDHTSVPEIRLEGKWLEKVGFEQGGYIKIQVEKSKLTITVDNGENTAPLKDKKVANSIL